jgi:5-methylcytosine-specific restriction endonuclease McrA
MIRRTVLQLNASYEPLRIVSARKALTLVTKGVAVVEVPTNIQVHAGIFLPSVIRLRHYRNVPHKRPIPSRKNIFTRDGFRCLYCGAKAPRVTLELEHIFPKSRGGSSAWDNVCASCHACNQKKGDRTPEEAGMKLIHRPLPSTINTGRFILKSMGSEVLEWSRFLYNDSDGEQRLVARG